VIPQGFQPRLRSSFNTIVKVQKNALVFALRGRERILNRTTGVASLFLPTEEPVLLDASTGAGNWADVLRRIAVDQDELGNHHGVADRQNRAACIRGDCVCM